jgi:hypothetical protein
MLIGDLLIKHHVKMNVHNNDNWAPIHIAARRSSKECLLWIISQNKNLKRIGMEEFDLNLKVLRI